jgi:hypothetical protein
MPSRATQQRSDWKRWEATRDSLLALREHVLTTGIADNANSGYMLDVSVSLSVVGTKDDPIPRWSGLAKFWRGMHAGSTRDGGRMQVCYSFRTMESLLAYRDELEAHWTAPLLRIDAMYLYCVNPTDYIDSFIDLNPLPAPTE